ncbi:MAG TPA: hypothetical protein DCS07_06700 [Bdellovibrionales bacterium]|nr:MAG: hypothetical protein A2Z97_08145 [Bdellovibrionales bacterium GWB1_52_6]OFZ03819.1 MAG: hypothetical protein A2X97_15585 [Bdellovibrionales bacterium GWA1_52_35]HAR42307.1 hypothetical protein [Bdellovibrionales bacterium]HCM39746.1 hypothetical protein [Bdellovibrionales bacterium]
MFLVMGSTLSNAEAMAPDWVWTAEASVGGGRRTLGTQSSPASFASVSAGLSSAFDSGLFAGINGLSHWGEFADLDRLWMNSLSGAFAIRKENMQLSLIPRATEQFLNWQAFSSQTDVTLEFMYGTPWFHLGAAFDLGSLEVHDERYQDFGGSLQELKLSGDLAPASQLSLGFAFTAGKSGLSSSAYGLELSASYTLWDRFSFSFMSSMGWPQAEPDAVFSGFSGYLGYELNRHVSFSFSQHFASNDKIDPLFTSKEVRTIAGLSIELGNNSNQEIKE